MRSAICIGIVAAALPGRPSPNPSLFDKGAGGAETVATSVLIHFCGTHPDQCLLPLQAAGAAPSAAKAATPRRLVSVPPVARGTSAMDRRPATAALEHGA